MSVSAPEVRKWVVLGATLATMLAGAMAFGETPTPCQEAYLMTGPGEHRMSFEEFVEFYADTLCSPEQTLVGGAVSAGDLGSEARPQQSKSERHNQTLNR